MSNPLPMPRVGQPDTYARCVRSTIPWIFLGFLFSSPSKEEINHLTLHPTVRTLAGRVLDKAQDKAQTGSQPGEHSISSEGVELNRVRRARAGATSAKAAASLQYGLKHGW